MNPVMDGILNETAAILNHEFQITPILFASYGLEKITGISFDAHDVDIFVPKKLLINKQPLIASFKKNGFRYIEAEVMTFVKNEIEVELSEKEKWFRYCDLQETGMKQVETPKFKYQILDADNLLRLYRFLSLDSRRQESKRKKDRIKILVLEKFLSINR
ncbi:MAG: hypothetical protein NTV44_00275 [Firmicutes bacterium]|nr:hypothetical protein [Bacillota bacterium]